MHFTECLLSFCPFFFSLNLSVNIMPKQLGILLWLYGLAPNSDRTSYVAVYTKLSDGSAASRSEFMVHVVYLFEVQCCACSNEIIDGSPYHDRLWWTLSSFEVQFCAWDQWMMAHPTMTNFDELCLIVGGLDSRCLGVRFPGSGWDRPRKPHCHLLFFIQKVFITSMQHTVFDIWALNIIQNW